MGGRTTHKRPELPLTEAERLALSEARAVVAELSERGPAPEELSELGYEQRMARGRALELAATAAADPAQFSDEDILIAADKFYDFIWKGEVPDDDRG